MFSQPWGEKVKATWNNTFGWSRATHSILKWHWFATNYMKAFYNYYSCICLFSILFKFYLNYFQHSTLLLWSLKLIPKKQMNQLWKFGLLYYTSKGLFYSGRSWIFTFPNSKVIPVCFEEEHHPAAGAEETFLSADLNHSSCNVPAS